jgi:hypothetical protein
MKLTTLILIVLCGITTSCTFNQSLPDSNLRDKETKEIDYLTDCIKLKKKADSLIEWKVDGSGEIRKIFRSNGSVESGFLFEYKSRFAYFIIDNNSNGIFLKQINYNRSSFQKTVYLDETSGKYEITSDTQFNIWMSKDGLSIYFCMINSDDLIIWVLSKENTVYTL